MDIPFIGREKELATLNDYATKNTASLIVIHGRRHIGKSRLTDEFGKNKTYYHFTGLAPGKGITAQKQRNEFARKLGEYFSLPGLKADDWADLFIILAAQCKRRRVVILLDELTWMAMDDPTFLGKLRNAWDKEFKRNNKLMLILCSSVSSWIEKNILSSTGFLGRVHYVLTLEELPLKDCVSFYEKLKYLAVTGGVPLYLESYDARLSSEENIRQLCFKSGGLLVREFENIFSDLFGKQSVLYVDIVNALANGPLEIKEISQKIARGQTGWHSVLGYQIENLILNNRSSVWKALTIYPDEIVNDNPYFQRETNKQRGCQIDYMVQTKFNNLYVGEIKFSRSAIHLSVIKEVYEKIERIHKPKGFSCRPFLIHVNGVTDEVMDQDYFSRIISFEELVKI